MKAFLLASAKAVKQTYGKGAAEWNEFVEGRLEAYFS